VNEIYMGTILLEVNRWARPEKTPSYRVSEWIGRFEEAGFDGMELWQYHASKCGSEELSRLEASTLPIPIFNPYAPMTEDGREERRACDVLARRLGASAIKFNIGNDPVRRDEYLRMVREWRAELPAEIRLLCECHPGTLAEDPEEAWRFFEDLGVDGWDILVHPFSRLDSLQAYLDRFGPRVVHAHLQMRPGHGDFFAFRDRVDVAKEAIGVMQQAGFAGSYTLEFAVGTGAEGESAETLYAAALEDLAYLRDLLA